MDMEIQYHSPPINFNRFVDNFEQQNDSCSEAHRYCNGINDESNQRFRGVDHSILNVEQGELYEQTRTKEFEYRKTTNQMDSNQMFIGQSVVKKDQKRPKTCDTSEPKISSSVQPPLTPMLPPCRVCGEKASGFHYGANTCEACKGFFRRSLYRKESYQCLGSNTCTILPGKRNICASCRYKKCLTIGMSKTAIKTGRYTHEKKTRDIREVKRLQRQQQFENSNHEMNWREGSFNALDENEVNDVLGRIMDIHRSQTPHTKEFFDILPTREQEYLTSRQWQQNIFGSLKPIACQEYFKIYHTTGIDLDGRRAMMEHMIPCIEKAVRRFVAFAKAIPGFKEFPIEDQIKLIKGSRFEAWLISSYRAFNGDHLIYTHFCGYTVHLEDMARIYDDCFLHSVFKVANMIKRLDFSEEEECIVKAIILLFRDRSPLEEPDKVEASQLKMIDILQCIRHRRKPNDKNFFARVIDVLVELRTLTDLHTIQENKINMEWATNFQMPPLLYDLFSF